MFRKLIIITLLLSIFQQCHSPVKPLYDNRMNYTKIAAFETDGYGLNLDLTDKIVALSANYDGTYVLNIEKNENGEVTGITEQVHLTDWEANIGEEKSNKVIISENHNLLFIMDMNDRIYLYKLDGEQYSTNYLSGCFGDNWRDFVIDDSQADSIFIYPLVKHSSADPGAPYDAESTSLLHGLITFNEEFNEFEMKCYDDPYGSNHSILGEYVSFSDSLFAFAEGELGVSIYKQNYNAKLNNEKWDEHEGYNDTNENGQYDFGEPFDDINMNGIQDAAENFIDVNGNGIWDEGEEFEDCGEYDWQPGTIFCSVDNPVGNGVWDAEEPFDDLNGNFICDMAEQFSDEIIPIIQFDLPGEIQTIKSFENTVFTGHSYNKGCYMSFLDENGGLINKIAIADGYNIRGIDTNGDLIILAAGYDGILIYEWLSNSIIKFIGSISSGYANSVKIKNNNVYSATRDGLEIYKIER